MAEMWGAWEGGLGGVRGGLGNAWYGAPFSVAFLDPFFLLFSDYLVAFFALFCSFFFFFFLHFVLFFEVPEAPFCLRGSIFLVGMNLLSFCFFPRKKSRKKAKKKKAKKKQKKRKKQFWRLLRLHFGSEGPLFWWE